MTASAFQDFAVRAIGAPYAVGARGPDAYDCWGLVYCAYREVLSVTLDAYPVPRHVRSDPYNPRQLDAGVADLCSGDTWRVTDAPQDGCLVAMGRSRVAVHVGLWLDLDGGLCLHALDGAAVVAQTLAGLRRQRLKPLKYLCYGDGSSCD